MAQTRTGFKPKEKSPDWWLDGAILCWKNPAVKSININELPKFTINSDEFHYESESLKGTHKGTFKEILKNPIHLSSEERVSILSHFADVKTKNFLDLSPLVFENQKWSDAEKLFFLNVKIQLIDGFKFGNEVQRLIANIKWKSTDVISRMNEFYSFYLSTFPDRIDLVNLDSKRFNGFSKNLIVYRGFNVPVNKIIRDKNIQKAWYRQEYGKSIYFSASEGIARWFACINKVKVIQKIRNGMKLSSEDKEILGGRLCIAKYSLPIDNVVIYQSELARKEDEIIALPSKAELKNYKFLGFNDFIKSINNPPIDELR